MASDQQRGRGTVVEEPGGEVRLGAYVLADPLSDGESAGPADAQAAREVVALRQADWCESEHEQARR